MCVGQHLKYTVERKLFMSRKDEDQRDGQFIKTGFGLLENEDFLKNNRCKYMLYLLIRKFSVRKPFIGDLGLHKNFWEKGYIAASKPISKLASMLGYKSSSSIRKWINELVEDKALVLEEVYTKPGRPQNVFILGIHNACPKKDYKEYYYIDEPELITEFGVKGMVDFYKLLKTSTSKCKILAL